jgi:hypothetical protein
LKYSDATLATYKKDNEILETYIFAKIVESNSKHM